MTDSAAAEAIYESPFGPIFLRADYDALLKLYFVDDAAIVNIGASPKSSVLTQTFHWLDQYFSGQQPSFCPPIRLSLTPFNTRVLEIASQVKFGETITYGMIAEVIAVERGLAKMSARAVGSAMHRNPICLIVPCHRVVGANHHLGGYNGNPARKRQLLAHEGVDISNLI